MEPMCSSETPENFPTYMALTIMKTVLFFLLYVLTYLNQCLACSVPFFCLHFAYGLVVYIHPLLWGNTYLQLLIFACAQHSESHNTVYT
jgi:hypothetical protein